MDCIPGETVVGRIHCECIIDCIPPETAVVRAHCGCLGPIDCLSFQF